MMRAVFLLIAYLAVIALGTSLWALYGPTAWALGVGLSIAYALFFTALDAL